MIRHTLSKAIQWVKRMARKRRRHDPLVMRLVQRLVHRLVMEPTVDPIDAQICEGNEEGELQVVIEAEGRLRGCVIEARIATYFEQEAGGCKDGHDGHGDHRLSDLEAHLVLEVFGVRKSGVIEDEEVGEGREEEVGYEAEEPRKSRK